MPRTNGLPAGNIGLYFGLIGVCAGCAAEPGTCTARLWYLDDDSDGWGREDRFIASCTHPVGYAELAPDCDDGNPTLGWYQDLDGDGYGDPAHAWGGCEAPDGYVAQAGDCDDSLSTTFPGAPERCGDGSDNGCDGVPDDCAAWGEYEPTSYAVMTGPNGSSAAGSDVAGVGDLTGDGIDDVLIGARNVDLDGRQSVGAAYLITHDTLQSGELSDSAHAIMTGDQERDHLGYAVARAGDVNGDGRLDVLVAGYTVVHLVLGPLTDSRSISETSSARISFDTDYLDLQGLDDIDHDGFDDFAVGAPFASDSAGEVAVFRGPTEGSLVPEDAYATLVGPSPSGTGEHVSAAGDLNGDGVSDFLISSSWYGENGDVALGIVFSVTETLPGRTNVIDYAEAVLVGHDPQERAGSRVDGGADFDNDGYKDILVGSSSDACIGGPSFALARVVSGTVKGRFDLADADMTVTDMTQCGWGSVSWGGDLDRDGFEDMLIGHEIAWDGDVHRGGVFLFHGPLSGTHDRADADAWFKGGFGDAAGAAVDSAGDINDDGYPDFVFGAEFYESQGAAFVVLGAQL